jgi:glutamine synthetase
MSNLRFHAIKNINKHVDVNPDLENKVSDYYGKNVFTEDAMRQHLPNDVFKKVKHAIANGTKLDREIANEVSNGMKAWAMTKGVTHYTHWFQPLTGTTAEKHDAFFTPTATGKGIEAFDGNALIQQEPDASSFPNGGIRSTFEARGYTAWDPSSPAFIMEVNNGKTLCIPTIFVAYSGEALDYKAPLLKSLHLLETAALPVVNYFDKACTKVHATLGWEQEYFVIDEELFLARPDLMMTGRTIFGHTPAKGQQLEDHYFGTIPERVFAYMMDFEKECFKLGIPLKTRHNEVAPGQYEVAPVFEEVNIAVDHNQLLMDIMERVARRHRLKVLLHEKPFAGVNGSGKHNNWSLGTDTGSNLLSPGKTPKTNLQFLTFFVNTIKAVHDHADLVRASIASAGNDHRLGANEAPPAIISVFAGTYLSEVLKEIESRVSDKNKPNDADKVLLKMDIHNKIPDLLMDNTDRNRTSPFAFTGNKFEFRAVGSSANCSSAMTVLNTIVANQLLQFHKDVEAIAEKGERKDGAILTVLRKYISASKNILFEGDNYSDEWKKEATTKRGLKNITTTPPALDAYVSKSSVKLFVENGIFNETELHARYDIMLEDYFKKVQIEARVMEDIAMNQILPTAFEYQSKLIANAQGLKDLGLAKSSTTQIELIKEISERIATIKTNCVAMNNERKKANAFTDMRKKAVAYCDKVKPYFDVIRYEVDKLEEVIDDQLWPLPKYREMLFVR